MRFIFILYYVIVMIVLTFSVIIVSTGIAIKVTEFKENKIYNHIDLPEGERDLTLGGLSIAVFMLLNNLLQKIFHRLYSFLNSWDISLREKKEKRKESRKKESIETYYATDF